MAWDQNTEQKQPQQIFSFLGLKNQKLDSKNQFFVDFHVLVHPSRNSNRHNFVNIES